MNLIVQRVVYKEQLVIDKAIYYRTTLTAPYERTRTLIGQALQITKSADCYFYLTYRVNADSLVVNLSYNPPPFLQQQIK